MKLVILTPPGRLTAEEARYVQDQIARHLARGNDVEALILADGWQREVVEDDQVLVRLDRDCLREDDPRLPRAVVEIVSADGRRRHVRGTIESMDFEPAEGQLIGTFEEVPAKDNRP